MAPPSVIVERRVIAQVEVLAAEPAAERPPKPAPRRKREARTPEPTAPAWKPVPRPTTRPDDSAPPIPLVPLEEEPLTKVVPLAKDPASAQTPNLVVAADPLASPDRAPTEAYEEDFPVIPLKPLEADAQRDRETVWQGGALSTPRAPEDADYPDGAEELSTLRDPADVAFFQALATFGGFLSRLLNALVRFERQQRLRRAALRREAAKRREEAQRIAAAAASEGPPPVDEPRSLGELLASIAPAPRKPARVPEAKPLLPVTPAVEPRPPAPQPRPLLPLLPAPPALKPPPALGELPTLRLAEVPEPETWGEVYDGDDGEAGPGFRAFVSVAWLWTKRVVLLALLVGGGALAAMTWRSWFPKAGEVGQAALTRIDRQVRSERIGQARQRLLEEGAEQLPQLSSATIQLVLSRSSDETPDLIHVFQAAGDAADRGRRALTREEALELDALREELVRGLNPIERDDVRGYERARTSGAVFAADERAVVDLLARGARALPPQRLERLRALLGKAIAAGLPSGESASPPPAGR